MNARNELFEALTGMGWTIVRAKKHIIWRHPRAKANLVTAYSPSDWRAVKNIMLQARRLLAAT